MSERHPIDELFRRGLENHSPEVPMAIWEGIDQKRNWQHKLANQWRQRWPQIVGILILFMLLGWLLWPAQHQQKLDSFPIPHPGGSPIAQESAKPPGEREKADYDVTGEVLPAEENRAATTRVIIPSGPPTSGEDRQDMPAAGTEFRQVATDKAVELSETNISQLAPLPVLLPTILGTKSHKPVSILKQHASLELLPPLPAHSSWMNQTLEVSAIEPVSRIRADRWKLYIGISAFPAIASRKLSPNGDEFEAYARRRSETENSRSAFGSYLRLSAVSPAGLTIRGGVNYTQINERFDYINRNAKRPTPVYLYDSNGSVIGTDTTFVTGTRRKTTYNRYQVVNLPVGLGYEFSHKKVSVAFHGGALFNVYFRQRGDFLSPEDFNPVSFTKEDAGAYPAFRDKLGIAWYGSLAVHLKLRTGWQVFLEPNVQYYPESFTVEEFATGQHYVITGLSLGLRKRIN